ncbi:MAG: hypothetical protein QNJ18_17450 [Xenococcaceae cyanobacterium MO_167.B52]|nr:hypothetical protein [Xenococcaceae cyanobacterium MO_167.B52]
MLPNISSANKQERLARDLQLVLEMNSTDAVNLSREPLIYRVNHNKTKVTILFIPPFIPRKENQWIQIQSGDVVEKSDRIEINLSSLPQNVKYSAIVANKAYIIFVTVEIGEDSSVNIDSRLLLTATKESD